MEQVPVIGNDFYLIDSDFKISRNVKYVDEINVINNSITISLYNKIMTVGPEWLWVMSKYVVNLPKSYEYAIEYLKYSKIEKSKHFKEDYIVYFSKPILVESDGVFKLRLLARYSDYAINELGTIFKIHGGRYLKNEINEQVKENNKYVSITLFDKSAGKRVFVSLHRLVALAWVEPPEGGYGKNPVVNHINGLKYHYYYKNLEWVTFKENSKHAVREGLRTDNVPVILRNLDTGEIVELPSLTEATKYVGRSRINTQTTKITEKYIMSGTKGSFEIKFKDEDRDWYYKDKLDKLRLTRNQKLLIEITLPNGDVKYFKSVPEVIKDIFNGVKVADRLSKLTEVMKKRKPKHKIYIQLLNQYANNNVKYIAKRSVDDKEYVVGDRRKLIELTGVSKSSIQKSISTNGKYEYNGWRFKREDIPWDEAATITNKPKPIKLLDVNGIETIFTSFRSISEFLGVSRNVIEKHINTDSRINGYLILQHIQD